MARRRPIPSHPVRARARVSLPCPSVRQLLGVALVVVTMLALGLRIVPASDDALAKVSAELQTLYRAYVESRISGQPLVAPDPVIRVVEGRVIVDAVASDKVDELKANLVALGMEQVVSAGRIVSGQLPIAQIPAMAALPSLRFARAAMSTTH